MLLNKKPLFIPLVLLICSCNTAYKPIQSKSIFIANDIDVRFAELVHKRFFHEIKTEQRIDILDLKYYEKPFISGIGARPTNLEIYYDLSYRLGNENKIQNINVKDNVYVNEFNPVAQNNAVSQISYELMNQLIDELIMKVRN